MAIAYNTGVTGSASTASSVNITIPSGVNVNDVMIMALEVFCETSTAPTISFSGAGGSWTLVPMTSGTNPEVATAGSSIWSYCYAYYRVATAGDPGATLTISESGSASGTTWLSVDIEAYTGANTSSPIDVATGSNANNSNTTQPGPTINTVQANDWGIQLAGAGIGSGTLGGPATSRHTVTSTALIAAGISDTNGAVAAGASIGGGTWTQGGGSAWWSLFTIGLAPPSAGISGTEQPRATVPVPRRRPARGQSRGQHGAAYVAVAAPPQEYRTLPRRAPARGVSHGISGQAYVAVPAPPQEPYLPPRRKPGRAVIGFTPVTTTNAVPAVSGPPLQARPVPRRVPARGQSRGQGGQAYVAVPAPRQSPYLPPRRRPGRAVVEFTPVTTTNTPVAFVAVPAPRQMAAWPRRKPARAVIGFTPVTTTNGPPHHRPPGGTPSSDDARQFKRWLLWGA